MHECTQIGIKNIRQTISDTIVQAYREAGANALLQKTIEQLYAVDTQKQTINLTVETMPAEWRDAYKSSMPLPKSMQNKTKSSARLKIEKRMDHGHETEEEFMAGLAAEVIERVGGTKPLWSGLHTNAMVKMMFLGKIQTHAARGLIREVRTLLYEGKRAMWNIRNKNNFNDDG